MNIAWFKSTRSLTFRILYFSEKDNHYDNHYDTWLLSYQLIVFRVSFPNICFFPMRHATIPYSIYDRN